MPHFSDLHARIQSEIRQRQLLSAGQRILVAVSGGQDSLCLLKVLMDLRSRWQWQLEVIHCDHRWTDDETACADFMQGWVRGLGLRCAVVTADPITLDENHARQWRYQALAQVAAEWNCQAVVTGHTASDRAETFLFNLLRGTGSQGLASLDWKRPLDHCQLNSPDLVRPLLSISRQETGEFCQHSSLPVWPDLTNQDLSHPRNRLRLEVMPLLKQHFNPQLEGALNRAADLLMAEHGWVVEQAKQLWGKVIATDPLRIQRRILGQQPLALQRQVIHQLLSQLLPHAPRFDQVERLQQLLSAPNRIRTPPFMGGGWAEAWEEWIFLREFSGDIGSWPAVAAKAAYDSASEPNS